MVTLSRRKRRAKRNIVNDNKDGACQDILDAANAYLARETLAIPRVLRRRGGLHEAVCIARRKMLVSNETLITAGFKPVRQRVRRW
jgi:hypothetical protein